MLSRARVLATVTLLIGCLAGPATGVQAQNLEAGKSASQLFAGTCSACHKAPRGLLKTVSSGSLTGFLREHYTTSDDMASKLSSYLISNGATDSRQAKQGADSKQGAGSDQQGRKQRGGPGQEAARPDAEEPAHEARSSGHRRLARPVDTPEEAKPAPNGVAAVERGSDGRKSKQRFSRPSRPEESPAAGEPKAEPAPGMKDQGAAREEGVKPEEPRAGEAKPAETPPNESKPAEAKSEPAAAASDGSTEQPAPRLATPAPAAPTTMDAPAAAASVPSTASAPVTPPPVAASAPPPAPAGAPVPSTSK